MGQRDERMMVEVNTSIKWQVFKIARNFSIEFIEVVVYNNFYYLFLFFYSLSQFDLTPSTLLQVNFLVNLTRQRLL